MAPITQASTVAGSSGSIFGGFGRFFGKLLFTGRIFFLIVILVFANAVVQSFSLHSFQPLVDDVFAKFVVVTNDLSEKSLAIIEHQGLYDPSDGMLKGIALYVWHLFELISALALMLLWLRGLVWIIEKLPGTFSGNTFVNYAFAIFIFIIGQVIFVLIYSAVNQEIHSASDAFDVAAIPIQAFSNFAHAIPYVLKPVENLGGIVTEGKATPPMMNQSINSSR
jgi:hypothetical protein